MSRTVEIGWENEDGEAFRVVCSVTLGTPDRGPDFNCAGGYPGNPPEVEVLEVAEDAPGGALRPDMLDVVERDLACVQERAIELAGEDDEESRWDTLEEARGER